MTSESSVQAPAADTPMPSEIADALRRYMQLQREILRLEEEKAHLRDCLAVALGDQFPAVWRPVLDAQSLLIHHGTRTMVRYEEPLLRERLGDRYVEILEIDATKIRKNRDAVRPLLRPILDRVGTPQANRVEAAIRAGTVSAAEFRGAFSKTYAHSLSVRIERAPSPAPQAGLPEGGNEGGNGRNGMEMRGGMG